MSQKGHYYLYKDPGEVSDADKPQCYMEGGGHSQMQQTDISTPTHQG